MKSFYIRPDNETVKQWIWREGGYEQVYIKDAKGNVVFWELKPFTEHHACMLQLFHAQSLLSKTYVEYHLHTDKLSYLYSCRLISRAMFEEEYGAAAELFHGRS